MALLLAPPPGIDHASLRGFVMIAECGSLQIAGHRLGSSGVALSGQLQRLETLLGRPLLTRRRNRLVPTPHGAWLLARAKVLLEGHDSILAAFHRPRQVGALRFGVPEDYVQPWLARIIGGFTEVCPNMAVEVVSANVATLLEQVRRGAIEVAVVCNPDGGVDGMDCRPLWRGELGWFGSPRHDVHRHMPLPLAVAAPGCALRRAAIAALDSVCMPWRIACTTAMSGGGMALVQAGLAVTVGLPPAVPAGLRCLGPEVGMPRLASFSLHLLVGGTTEGAAVLARTVEAVFGRTLGPALDLEGLVGHAA